MLPNCSSRIHMLLPVIGVFVVLLSGAVTCNGQIDPPSAVEHRLGVSDATGRVLNDDLPSSYRDRETLVRVPQEGVAKRQQAETISIQQLQHKSSRKARSEFNRGRKALNNQQFAQAVEHLKSTLALDPSFADAHNDLGVAYTYLEDYPKSVEHFRKAIDLAPTHAQANDNLCLALLASKHFTEAGLAAARILSRPGNSAIAHYAAAIALIVEGGNRREALDHLQRVDGRIPEAHLVKALILAGTGRVQGADKEVQAYLRSRDGSVDPGKVQAWLAGLTRLERLP